MERGLGTIENAVKELKKCAVWLAVTAVVLSQSITSSMLKIKTDKSKNFQN